jgi:regulator of ribonuclease activity A
VASQTPPLRHPLGVTATSDVLDEHGDDAAVCTVAFRKYGGRRAFAGAVATVRCQEDNVLIRRRLSEPGEGLVLVVDGGGSLRAALLGDQIAGLAVEHGWAGLVVYGAVRDVAALAQLDVGIDALGSNPRPSRKAGAGEVDVPVEFGGVTFRPGDALYSDEDGLVVLRRRG